MEDKIDKRTKEYRDGVLNECAVTEIDYSDKANNPGWSKCFKCGADLEPNEDGSAKYRRQPTPEGREGRDVVEYIDSKGKVYES
jgi:hypothetical protein